VTKRHITEHRVTKPHITNRRMLAARQRNLLASHASFRGLQAMGFG